MPPAIRVLVWKSPLNRLRRNRLKQRNERTRGTGGYLLATPLFCKDQRDIKGRRSAKEERMMTHTPPGWIEPETVRVRPEAALDLAVVSRFLRPRLPNTDGPLEVVQFAGGHANPTYLLRFCTQEYVLRPPPSGPVAPGAYDMAREVRGLSALWPGVPPAPRPFLLWHDARVVGAPFFA